MKLRAITVRIPHEADADIEALCATTARRAGFPVREGDVLRAAFLRGVKVLLQEAQADEDPNREDPNRLAIQLFTFSARVREITTKTGSAADPQEQALLRHRVHLMYRDIITRLPLDDPRRRTVDQLLAMVDKVEPAVEGPPLSMQTPEEVHPDPKAVLYVEHDPEGLSDLYCRFIAAADQYNVAGGFPQARSLALDLFYRLYGRCPRTDPRWGTIVQAFESLNPSSQERPQYPKPTD